MSRQSKFEDVDVFASLSAIMQQNTGFFQSDFEIDKQIIQKAAASPGVEDKTLLWLCRPAGTHCFKEREVFLKDTAPHNTWRFQKEQTRDRILAYAALLYVPAELLDFKPCLMIWKNYKMIEPPIHSNSNFSKDIEIPKI